MEKKSKENRTSQFSKPAVPRRIGITGSPGTGKKSVGLELAKLLGLEFLSINDYAISKRYGSWKGGEFEVDIPKLKGRIRTRNRVVAGHLLPYIVPNEDLEVVFVLRCAPDILRERYLRRHYDEKKSSENLQAEVLGLISEKCSEVYDFAKLAEVDTSASESPRSTAGELLDMIIGKKRKTFGVIDWLSYAKSPSSLERLMQGKYHILNKTKKDN